MKILDISVPIRTKMPQWPGDSRPRITQVASLKKKDESNVTMVEMGLHTGTHLDAPLHFLPGGGSIDTMPLGTFVGPAFVSHLPKAKIITAEHIARLRLPKGTTRVLFKTSNSKLWSKKGAKFKKDFVGLSGGAAAALVKRGIRLVGVDYLSVAAFAEVTAVHEILLKKKVALLEGLNLTGVRQGTYQLICLPLYIPGAEAAPARAVLLKL